LSNPKDAAATAPRHDLSRTDGARPAPHPPLTAYYPAAQSRDRFVRDIFDETAASYDRINKAFSFGSGAWYRRRALQRAGLAPGQRLLDVAVGTGLVAREAVRILGRPGDVVGLDLSEGMLREARRTLSIPLIRGRAEALPVGDASFDFLSMGYALRHVANLDVAFQEYRRVLRPGGRLLLLEIGRPDGRIAYAAAKGYLGTVVPAFCRQFGGGERAGTLMQYYWDTIDACVPPSVILQALTEAGFTGARCEEQFGIFRAYTAQNPASLPAASMAASAPLPRPSIGPGDFDALAARVVGLYAGASRFVQGFVGGKLRGDPATQAVLHRAAATPFGAVADLGCGRGQLGLALLTAGLADHVTGLDRDGAKVADASRAAAGLAAEFAVADLGTAAVPACDTALLIDILVQMPEEMQHALLARVAAAARRRVLIRAFDPACGWRSKFGLAMESLGRTIRRDGAEIRPLPLRTIAAPFEAAGFTVSVTPCWGRTPLPNVLLVAERASP
jgi:demethylmenaquinone methyltransferase/2-methoxy-6-polyprenyl-1,4-benzoquinol methylase